MKYLTFCLPLIFILMCFRVKAQEKQVNIEQYIADIFEQYSAESEQETDFESFYEDLTELWSNPVELNSSQREQLRKLPFLSDIQIENIIAYIYTYGPLNSIYELQLIDGLDMTDIRRMLPFVKLTGNGPRKPPAIYRADLLKYGKNKLALRLDKGWEPKAGYQQYENTTEKYAGSSYYNSMKYEYRFKDRIKFGLTMEKDAGEQLQLHPFKGYDFFSMHLQFNETGRFKTIVAGDFRASFGLGLVLGSAFGTGKSSYVLKAATPGDGLKKYSSTNEYNFFRGAGATCKFGKFDLSAFYSNKNIDADTLNNSFQSIYKTGLHRTIAEISKQHTVNEQVTGFNAVYTGNNFQTGATIVRTVFNHQLIPEKKGYNYYSFSGKQQLTGGINYRYRLFRFNLFGETAFSNGLSVATINCFSFSPHSQISLLALYRFYSPDYNAFYAGSFSEGSGVNNEKGLYLGAEIRPFKKWKISAYADNFQFLWPKYGVDLPSMGEDYLIQFDYTAKRDVSMFWRCRYESKQINASDTELTLASIVPAEKASFRYQLNYTYNRFIFKNIIEAKLSQKNHTGWTYGFSSLQDISFSFAHLPLHIDLRYQFFDAADYDNRFYTYEKDILNAFSIPVYYGAGSRYYFNIRYDVNNHLSLWFKLAQTVYADGRETISSGGEEITGNRKTDLRFLIQFEF